MSWLYGIILFLLPIINFIIQYAYTHKAKTLPIFKDHWTSYWCDFIFVPINLLFFFINTIPLIIIGWIFLGSIVLNYIMHRLRWWANKQWVASHMFYFRSSKLNPAWITHFIFSIIETTILTALIFSQHTTTTFFLVLGCVSAFSVLLLLGSYHIHKKIAIRDSLVIIALLFALIVRFIV